MATATPKTKAKKAPARKTAARKAPAKKAAVKKTAAPRKTAAKKLTVAEQARETLAMYFLLASALTARLLKKHKLKSRTPSRR